MSSGVPTWTMPPSFMMAMRSPMRIASSRSWVMKTVVFLHTLRELRGTGPELAADQRVERREGLVHQQDARVGGQRAGEPDALLHAAGKFVGVAVAPAGEIDERELLVRDLGGASCSARRAFRALSATLSRTVRCGSSAMFWNTMPIFVGAQRPQLRGAELVDVARRRSDLARGRLDQPVDVAHQRRLAGPRQPHDAEDLARPTAKYTSATPTTQPKRSRISFLPRRLRAAASLRLPVARRRSSRVPRQSMAVVVR